MAVDESEGEGLPLRGYARAVWRRKWIVVATTVLLTGLALGYSYSKTPLYQASSQLIYDQATVNPLDVGSSGSVDPTLYQADLNSVASVIVSPALAKSAEAAMVALGGPVSDYSVSAAPDAPVDTSGSGVSNTVTITAVSPSPTGAARAANAYAKAFTDYRKANALQNVQQAISVLKSRLSSYLTPASRQTGDYAILQQRLQDLQILMGTTTGGFTVLVPAGVPNAPFTPRKMRNGVVGFAGGLVFGIGIALLLGQFDTRVRTPEEAAAIFGLPILGHIRKTPAKVLEQQALVVLSDSHSPAAESIRKLQWSLEFANVDGDLNSLLVTSCLQHEGKTLTACNLALSLAATGKRVVLVDADLRRPRVHHYMNVSNKVGVSTVLTGKTDLAHALHALRVGWSSGNVSSIGEPEGGPNGGNRLHVLTSGPLPPNAAEIIASKSFAGLIEELQTRFDMVLVDTPALLAVGDSAAVARVVGGVLFLVDLTRAKRPLLAEAAAQLAPMPCRKLGLVVMSEMPSRRYRQDHYTYYSHAEAKSEADTRKTVRV